MECRWEHKVGCVREIELISGGFSQHQKGIFDDMSMGVLPLLMGHSEEVIGGWKPLVQFFTWFEFIYVGDRYIQRQWRAEIFETCGLCLDPSCGELIKLNL